MGKILVMPNEAIISGFRDKVDYYYYMGQPCFRRWPRSPGRVRTPAVMAWWAPFTNAVKLWPQLSPEVKEAYRIMAGNSGLSAKDMHQRAYMKGLYRNPLP